MTKKVVKWWQHFSFWDKIRMTLGAVGIGGEVTLYIADLYPDFRIYAALATLACIGITYFFTDKNKNGIVDWMEKYVKK